MRPQGYAQPAMVYRSPTNGSFLTGISLCGAYVEKRKRSREDDGVGKEHGRSVVPIPRYRKRLDRYSCGADFLLQYWEDHGSESTAITRAITKEDQGRHDQEIQQFRSDVSLSQEEIKRAAGEGYSLTSLPGAIIHWPEKGGYEVFYDQCKEKIY